MPPRVDATVPPAGVDGPSPTAVGDLVDLEVGAVAHGGFCVARQADGIAVFVRHALPGERVTARVTEVRPRYRRADAVEVVVPSPDRVERPCPFAGPGRCGGCDWQHAALPYQRVLKSAVVAEQLQRLAGLEVDVVVEEVPGAEDGLRWRTRVGWAVRRDGVVGLHRHRSHAVEPVDDCRIAHGEVTALGVERRRWPHVRAVAAVASPSTGDRLVVVTPVGRRQPLRPAPLDADAAFLRDDGHGRTTTLAGSGAVHEAAGGRSWRVSGSGFWQIHPAAATVLHDCVLALVAPRAGELALDLYCGVGLFAGGLASAVGPTGRVVAVESDAGAVRDARHNLADLPQTVVHRGRVGAEPLTTWADAADLVVLDPPRSGAGAALCAEIAALRPRAVAYVACDPASLARDTATMAALGYRLARLRAFDLFPMTAHVECVALFEPAG